MVQAHAFSDVGPVRSVNEDSFLVADQYSLFVVADGMGGHSAGELASRLAVEAVEGFIARSHNETDFSWPCGIDSSLSLDANRLKTAVFLANRRVVRLAESRDDYVGMGTTVVAVLISGLEAAVAHVGDSRLYLFRDGQLSAKTVDDSWLASMLAASPDVDAEQLRVHPMRHVLTNVVGARDEIEIHVAQHALRPGDCLLLCSDGLHNALDEDEMAAVLTAAAHVEQAAAGLVGRALERGARDNTTALVVRCTGDV